MELEKDKPRFSKTNVHTCLRSMICRMKKRGKILAAIDERVPSLKVTRKQYRSIRPILYTRVPHHLRHHPPLCCIFHGASISAWKSRVCFLTNRNISARSATRNTRSIVTLAFRRIGGGKGGGIRWQKKKEIRYVNGHRAPLLCFACGNMETKKIWKRKKRNGEFLKFCQLLVKPLCTL